MPDPDPTPTPAPDPAPAPDDPPEPKKDEPKPYTQAELDRMFQDRVARERQKFADYDDLKAKAEKFDKLEADSQTELEKAQQRAEKAERDRNAALETANDRLIEAAVLAEGTSQKAIKPEHLHKLIDRSSVTVGDDGQVTGAADAVKAFLDANPEYVGTTRALGDADQGARTHGADQLSREALKTMTPDEIAKALDDGRLASLTGAR